MRLLDLAAILISLAALFSYLNFRYLRLPTTIGVMLFALLLSLALIGFGWIEPRVAQHAEQLLSQVDFDETLLLGMLSFLLFAGALHVNINDLARQRWIILTLAVGGVIVSTLIVGTLSWWLFAALGLDLTFSYCLLFGALISPTDPIAVLGILKTAGVPKTLESTISGESLFNDGVAVVLFIILSRLATGSADVSVGEIAGLFALEALGGVVYGLALGFIAYRMLRSVDRYQVEILLTLALVMGGYAVAHALHVSGPIAIVVAGLLIGNHGRLLAMSKKTREHLDMFWELLDEILNAVLFVLIGLEVLVLAFTRQYMLAGLLAIVVVLLARFTSVALPIAIMRWWRKFNPHVIKILTWGGLRGGISVALALSLPPGHERELIVAVTYIVVVFSIVVQGLTIGTFAARSGKSIDERLRGRR
jgi:CPA1 family monovalent cation:H+ antiporter